MVAYCAWAGIDPPEEKHNIVCEFCNTEMTDLTKGKGEHRNWYCHGCKGHYWKGVWYSQKEWDKWLEEEVPDEL